jgi:hypothetical protein
MSEPKMGPTEFAAEVERLKAEGEVPKPRNFIGRNRRNASRVRPEDSRRTSGQKGERRSLVLQAPPLLRQRKPYLTGSPPSRQERRCRPNVE